MGGLIRQWNASLEECKSSIQVWNQAVNEQFQNGELSAEAAVAAVMPEPAELQPPGERWARWFLSEWGWSLLSRGSDAQIWLPFNHPDMVESRAAFRRLLDKEQVHAGLVLNFDQVWRSAWTCGGKLMWKTGAKGERVPRSKAPQKADKKIHTVKHSRRGITVTRLHRMFFVKYSIFSRT